MSARRIAWTLLALACVYGASVAVVGISGDFPLNDDWAYTTTTRAFVRTGVFTPSSWSAVPLLTQVLFAAPVCLATACSAEDLRVTTLVASLVLIAATFALLRVRTRDTALAAVAAAALAFNPVAYTLAFTFMTDTLFAALLTLGALLFVAALERRSTLLVAAGTAVAIAATLTRQLGLCLPLAFLAVSLVRMVETRRWRETLLPALLPAVACGTALLCLRFWLQSSGRLPALYDIKSNILVETLHAPFAALIRVAHNLSVVLLYLGLFTLPVAILTRAPAGPRGLESVSARLLPRVLGAMAVVLPLLDLVLQRRLMPVGGNVVVAQGVGPLLLRDAAILGSSNVPPLPPPFWLCVTGLALLGAYLLAERLAFAALAILGDLAALRHGRTLAQRRYGLIFVVLAACAYTAPLLLIPFFDRYLVPLLPLAFFVVAGEARTTPAARWRPAAATALCLATGLYAVLAVHDYLAWNRARWQAIADLEASAHIGAESIDGGMEYNGLRAYRADYTVHDGRSWWWVDRDTFQIAFGPIAGTELVKRYPYRTLLPPDERAIAVLRRVAEPETAVSSSDPGPSGMGQP